MSNPKLGQLSACVVCGKTIKFGGERWHHADGKMYRHTPKPQVPPAAQPPPGCTSIDIAAVGPGCVVEAR